MARHGKKYLDSRKLVEGNGEYDASAALDLVTRTARAGFDETVEVAVRLGVDPRQADQMVRGVAVLPHGTGKTKRVLVFAKGEKTKEAEEAGADFVGAEDMVARIEGGWLGFEATVATPDMMGTVSKLGKILGPKGLMPNPKAGTVTLEVGKAVREIKAGKIEYRVDKTGIVHVPIGKVSFGREKLLDNFLVLLDALIRSKPAAARGQYLRSISMSSTMGPGVRVGVQKAVDTLGGR